MEVCSLHSNKQINWSEIETFTVYMQNTFFCKLCSEVNLIQLAKKIFGFFEDCKDWLLKILSKLSESRCFLFTLMMKTIFILTLLSNLDPSNLMFENF